MQEQFYQTPFQKRSTATRFREAARAVLSGRWGLAVGVFLLACILGMNRGISLSYDASSVTEVKSDALALLEKLRHVDRLLVEQGVMDAVRYVLYSWIGVKQLFAFAAGAVTTVAVRLFVGAPITVGYHRFLLDFADRKADVGVRTLFSAFSSTHYWRAIALSLLLSVVYWGVGMLMAAVLFIILTFAGVLKSELLILLAALLLLAGGVFFFWLQLRLSLCYHIMTEYPDLSAMDVIRNSFLLMRGNTWRYFCLQISFIGWLVVAACTCGLGMIVLYPYMAAADTAFYTEISGRDTAKEVEFPSLNPDDYFPSV